MQETESIDEYILQHIDRERLLEIALSGYACKAPSRPRMASGHLQGRMLKDVCRNDSASSDIGNRNV